jgi:hypothetical protein
MSTQRALEELKWVDAQPDERWSAPSGKSVAVLYSGYQGKNATHAKDVCAPEDSPRYRIEQTAAGQELDAKKLFASDSGLTRPEAEAVWDAASAKFAKQINGPVETNIISSDKDSIARGTELPIGLKESNATSVNGIPTESLEGLSERDRYYAIIEAELSQAKAQAAENPDSSKAVEDKEKGLAAVYARDMSADAQRLASQSTTPDQEKMIEFSPKENPEKNRKANDNVNEKLKAEGLADPREYVQTSNGPEPNAPRPIPGPNESYENLVTSTQATTASLAGPSEGVPPATSPPPFANDNNSLGPG